MVFLSHNGMDIGRYVVPLAQALKEHGLTTWYSERDVPIGSDRTEAVNRAIAASDCVVCILTDSVCNSPERVANELSFASLLNKQMIGIAMTRQSIPMVIVQLLQSNILKWYERPWEESLLLLLHELGSVQGQYAVPRASICPNCGSQIDPSRRFCPYCGFALERPRGGSYDSSPRVVSDRAMQEQAVMSDDCDDGSWSTLFEDSEITSPYLADPELPSAPAASSTPAIPEMPSFSTPPSTPTVPSIPSLPSITIPPSIPAVPSIPPFPSAPAASSTQAPDSLGQTGALPNLQAGNHPRQSSYSAASSSTGDYHSQTYMSSSAGQPVDQASQPARRAGLFGKLKSLIKGKPAPPIETAEIVSAEPARPRLSDVSFTAIAPRGLESGRHSIINVVMFEDGWGHVVADTAAQYTEAVSTTSSGWLRTREGTHVRVELACPDTGYVDSQESVWSGRYLLFSYPVMVPAGLASNQVLFTASVSFDGVPATRLSFLATVNTQGHQSMDLVRSDVHTAFISYASADRSRVATIVQGMQLVRPDLDLFFDVDSLRSGDDWESALRAEIYNRDVLFLCWSRNAQASRWVDFEWRYALAYKGISSIEPVAIESPDLCPPPAELSSKHFNDRLLYVIDYGSSR